MAIKWLLHTELPEGLYHSFAAVFSKIPSKALIKNVSTEFSIIETGNKLFFPITKNDAISNNSFVCSPFTAYTQYAKDELKSKVPFTIVQLPILLIIKLLEQLLRLGQIDKNIHINNFLLSTNPYQDWEGSCLSEITEAILQKYPQHAIVFKSLNEYQHKTLIHNFENLGYQKITSRQVYIFNHSFENWIQHNNNKNDLRIIKKSQLQYVSHEEMWTYLPEALTLYNQLYLEKYSSYNPQFTLQYFHQCHKKALIHFQGYKDALGKLKAFSGVFVVGNTITSPLVGYDISAPRKEGLYIHAIHLIMLYKFKTGKILNLSSGAAKFKRLRGGIPTIEYSLVFIRHLGRRRKLVWNFLTFISNVIGKPLLKKYEL